MMRDTADVLFLPKIRMDKLADYSEAYRSDAFCEPLRDPGTSFPFVPATLSARGGIANQGNDLRAVAG